MGVHLDTVLRVGGEAVPHRQKAKIKTVEQKKEIKNLKSLPTLADVEREVLMESREWGRQRLERRRQELAAQTGEVFPPRPAQAPEPDPAHRTGPGAPDR